MKRDTHTEFKILPRCGLKWKWKSYAKIYVNLIEQENMGTLCLSSPKVMSSIRKIRLEFTNLGSGFPFYLN